MAEFLPQKTIKIGSDKKEMDTKIVIDKSNKKESLMTFLAVCVAVFHLYTASYGILTGYIQTAIHWAFIGTIIILDKPLKFKGGILVDIVLIVTTIYLSVYSIILQNYLIFHPASFTKFDFIMSVIAIIVALIIGWRVLGPILPTICILFIAYTYYGSYFPGLLQTLSFSAKRIATYLYTMSDGLYGQTLLVSAMYLFLFIFFGSLMETTGAGQFFVDLANSFAGRVRGGPAQAALTSSMLMGMVNGSGAANVATTGTFTIPMMKKTGYKASIAGAIEAVASSGGQVMPPVMGAVAFLMSEVTGIPYSQIAISSICPAVLYYITISSSIYIIARKTKMDKPDIKSLPSLSNTFKRGWFHLIPLIVIVYLIFSGHSAQRSVFWAIVALFVVALLFNRKAITLPKLLNATKKAAVTCGPMASACMLAGVIMGTINITGLGIKIGSIIEAIANGQVFLALLLAMFASLLLGMGLPTSAAYIVLSVLVAPTLTKMGISTIAAHLFILYFGALSTITPPVALSTYTACGISGAGLWETGREAIKLASTGFVIPFAFVNHNELLFIGKPMIIVITFVTAAIGCVVLAVALWGWFIVRLSIPIRIIVGVSAIMLIVTKSVFLNTLELIIVLIALWIAVINGKRNIRTNFEYPS